MFVTRKVVALLAAGFLTASAFSMSAKAGVVAKVDLSSQSMSVSVNGRHYGNWKVSTGRRGYRTPVGSWSAKWLSRHHRSRKYNNAPMPYAIFFLGGYAVHGTNATRRLGRRASHGCIRLHPSNAAKLFALVQKHGRRNTRIRIVR